MILLFQKKKIFTKLSRNVPWMVLYKVTVFRSSRIFNMAARTNNMLWLAEISKIFFSETKWTDIYKTKQFIYHYKGPVSTVLFCISFKITLSSFRLQTFPVSFHIIPPLLHIFIPPTYSQAFLLWTIAITWRLSSVNFSHFKLLLRNHWADWNQT
jgi:hypothetical protein